jgi:hypothetical protein
VDQAKKNDMKELCPLALARIRISIFTPPGWTRLSVHSATAGSTLELHPKE